MNTVESKNKLVRELTEEQLTGFLEELVNTPGVSGPLIQEWALKKFGIKIGHESANNFRREVFGRYIERLRKRKELSATIAAHRDTDSGRTLADAASEELQQQVFEFLADNEALDLSDKDDLKRAEALSRIIKSARSEDRRMIDQLNDRIKELEVKQKAAEKALESATGKHGGISDETIKAVRKALGMQEDAP